MRENIIQINLNNNKVYNYCQYRIMTVQNIILQFDLIY
jgi:hypothetical protein